VSISSLVKPTMPLSGVRTSWLIIARNWPFARSPASACSSASRRTDSLRLTAVMSSKTADEARELPVWVLTGVTLQRTG
jgi:hypothetical protein